MRNLKKFLALALALVMTLPVLSIATAVFTDEEYINSAYEEAVDVLAALGVFQGRDDGSFDPQATITRAEVAAIIYRIATGDVNDEQVEMYSDNNKFDDVTSDQWFAGYVNYCANATYIKGRSDTIFDPDADITGYEVLAMILRVVGYDQNDEWTGPGWEIKVASTANELGVADGIKGTTLGSAVSREVVAQMLFEAIQIPCVTYTPAFGYNQNTTDLGSEQNESVGYKTFKLVGKTTDNDEWGRPSSEWKIDANENKEADTDDYALLTYEYEPAAVYTTMVDECDIAADLGIEKAMKIEAAYIDGLEIDPESELVSTSTKGTIDPFGVDCIVGGQGRLTEVYDMGSDGIRLVEINTYLAQVTDVIESVSDQKAHTSEAYIELSVYGMPEYMGEDAIWDGLPYSTNDEFAKGDYVLTTIYMYIAENEEDGFDYLYGEVKSVEPAIYGETGSIGWTNETAPDPNITTVKQTTYQDSDKFFLNYRSTEDSMTAVLDTYGNIIGLVCADKEAVASTYLVVEKIEWQNLSGTIGEGYAVADIILGDGTEVKGVVISTINGDPVDDNDTEFGGNESKASVSDNYKNNEAYYGHIYTYTVDENGNYEITYHGDKVVDYEAADGGSFTIKNGQTTISGETNKLSATNDTVFLILSSDNYTYKVYYGKNNVPTGKATEMCALTDENGYAVLVILKGFEADKGSTSSTSRTTTTFYAYVADLDKGGKSASNGVIYNVYKIGSTIPTVVYDKGDTLFPDATGIYKITVNNKNQIQEITLVVDDANTNEENDVTSSVTAEDGAFDRVMVVAPEKASSIQTAKYYDFEAGSVKLGAAYKDYSITDETTVINVTYEKDGCAALEEIEIGDVKAGDIVIIKYNEDDDTIADAIYVIAAGNEIFVASPITLTEMTYASDLSEFNEELSGEGFVITGILAEGFKIEAGSYLDFTICLDGTLIVSGSVVVAEDIYGGDDFTIIILSALIEDFEITTGTYTATVTLEEYETSNEVTFNYTAVPVTITSLEYDSQNDQFTVILTATGTIEENTPLTITITDGNEFSTSYQYVGDNYITDGSDFPVTLKNVNYTGNDHTLTVTVSCDGYAGVEAEFSIFTIGEITFKGTSIKYDLWRVFSDKKPICTFF